MKCGPAGGGTFDRPGPVRPASHWNCTGELGFGMSFGPGLGRSSKNFGISAQVVGNDMLVTGVPSTLTKKSVAPPTDTNVVVPASSGAWTNRSARLPPAKTRPAADAGLLASGLRYGWPGYVAGLNCTAACAGRTNFERAG